MDTIETIDLDERDGWTLKAHVVYDLDYVGGRDDDVYAELEAAPRNGDVPEGAHIVGNRADAMVTAEALAETCRVTGATERVILDDATAIANQDLYWVGVIVSASREGTELGEASLWGIDYDLRRMSESDAYLRETAGELADEAISEATKQLERLSHTLG